MMDHQTIGLTDRLGLPIKSIRQRLKMFFNHGLNPFTNLIYDIRIHLLATIKIVILSLSAVKFKENAAITVCAFI